MKKQLLLLMLLSSAKFIGAFHSFGKIDSSNNQLNISNTQIVHSTYYGPLLLFSGRYFFMNTANIASPSFYANGFNASVFFQSPNFLFLSRKFKMHHYNTRNYLGITAGYSHLSNLGSSNLELNNRYEIGLFDIQQPNNTQMGQLTRLNLYGTFSNFKFTLGRFIPEENPFVNAQDGRLRPTNVQGVNFEYTKDSLPLNFKFRAVFNAVNQILVRSTNDWKSINHTFGLYPPGVNVYGQSSNYGNSINSNNLLLFPSLSISNSKKRKAKVNTAINDSFYLIKSTNVALNYHLLYLNSVFTTQMFEIKGMKSLNRTKGVLSEAQDKTTTFSYGLMWIHQNSNTLNLDTNYIRTNDKSNVFSANLSLKKELGGIWYYQCTLAASRITKDGRYLMPREWGRDPFYTFMPRERNEGFGNLTAWTIDAQIGRRFKRNKILLRNLMLGMGFGDYKLPDVKDYLYNKYGMPSYRQLNTMLQMHFNDNKANNNLSLQLWFVHKFNTGNTYNQMKYEFNKVDMNQWNVILNYSYLLFR